MAHTLALDTLQYAKRLQKAGFTEIQAEAQVEIIKKQADAINVRLAGNTLLCAYSTYSVPKNIISKYLIALFKRYFFTYNPPP